MVRSVVLLVVGAVAGSAIAWQLQLRSVESPDSSADVLPLEPARPVVEAATDSAAAPSEDLASAAEPTPEAAASGNAGFATQRLAIYESAAGASDVAQLESMIRVASVAPESRLRDLELTVLLARLAEFDPARAVDFARQMYLESNFLIPLYRQWAGIDQDAAIRSLMLVSPAAVQREIALELLAITGFDDKGVALVARALPEEDRKSFEMDALVRLAETDPAAAIAGINALGESNTLSLSLQRVAESAALADPDSAMALSGLIENASARQAFRQMVLNAWAQSDPERAFAYVESAETSDLVSLTSALVALAASDASRALALSEQLPINQQWVRTSIMQSLAEQEPELALEMIRDMPLSQERDNLLQAIGQARGRQDPEVALSWARALDPPSPAALSAVIRGIADVDFDRAIDLMITELDAEGPATGFANTTSTYLSLIFEIARNSNSNNREQFIRLADRMIESPDMSLRSMMSSAISQWARNDSDGAINWLVSRAEKLDASSFSNAARQMAQLDLDVALATLNRLPEEKRGGWLEGTLSSVAQSDVEQALVVLERYRGQSGYADAYASVAREMARTDPSGAARMLDTAPPSQQLSNAALNISREWAGRDPAAAARWASEQADAQLRANSLRTIVNVWVQRDSGAARQWAMQMPSGRDRDAILQSYATSVAQNGEFDPQLFTAFSDESAGQRAAGNAISNIGRTDPERARQLLSDYIHDESVRRATEANLARTGGSGSGMIVSSGGIIFMN